MPGLAVSAPSPGPVLFGKLPSHGDFVARGLDASARQAWDAWASAGLDEARAALGEAAFEAAHDIAPPWRLVSGPGRFGPGWRAGVLAPSVDAAGRRFVVMLALEPLSEAVAAAQGEAIAEALEGLLWDGFAGGWDADRFVQAAGRAAAAAVAGAEAPGRLQERWWTAGGPDHPAQNVTGCPADLWRRMLVPSGERFVA